MTKAQVLARLKERHAKFSATLITPLDAESRSAIQRTLNALDHPRSHYAVLSPSEREHIRSEWQSLAASLGISQKPKRTVRQSRQAPNLPPRVLEFFGDATCLPHRPGATNDCTQGFWRTSWEQAQGLRYIDINPPTHVHWLIVDCDHDDPARWKAAGLLQPSFITVSPGSRRHHVVYRLALPVCRSSRARSRPINYLKAIEKALCHALGGDSNYVGILTKNPLHPAWETTRLAQMPVYRLDQLAASVDLQANVGAKPKQRSRGVDAVALLPRVHVGGRNNALFNAVRLRPKKITDIQGYAGQCNTLFPEPLGLQEVQAIVDSIERHERGDHRGRRGRKPSEQFRKKQSELGKLGGRPKTTGSSRPWIQAGISRSTWYRRQKEAPGAQSADATLDAPRGGRPATTKDSCPWKSTGVSRATWYRNRNQAEEAFGETA